MIWSTVCRFCFISKNPFRAFSPVKILSLAVDQLKGVRSYFDVSDFSEHPPGQQALVVNSIRRALATKKYWKGEKEAWSDARETELCIGDGYIFVFKSATVATRFAAYFAHLVEHLVAAKSVPVEFHFRVGIHFGDVYRFWDDARRGRGTHANDGTDDGFWNYVGAGINGGNRVLAAIGKETDDVVYISGAVRQAIYQDSVQPRDDDLASNAQIVYSRLENRGRHKDKHDKPWRVFQVNHSQLHGLDLIDDAE
jgi:class 3 adenylate cyclase